jgi:acetyl esterase/lipase
MEKLEYPPLDDVDAWRAMIASYEETVGAILGDRVSNAPVKTQDRDFGDFAAYEITPLGLADDDRRVYLDIHGGGFINGGGESCRAMGIGTALRVGARVWTPDYPHAAGSSVPGGPR